MPFTKFYPSDAVGILSGFDGTESDLRWYQRYQALFSSRLAFAINQYYPELESGFYRNKNLLAVIQDAMSSLGLHTVIWDNYRKDGMVPEETGLALETEDDYLLVTDSRDVVGRMNIWDSMGGRGRFYHDCLIVEILSDAKRCDDIRSTAEGEFRKTGVKHEAHDGTPKPIPVPLLKQILSRLVDW